MELNLELQSVQRKRGRPAGKNRVPLSQEERRARNAQYEKERRDEQAEAAAMLAEAAGFEPNLPLMPLLDRVTSFLKKEAQRDSSDDITGLTSLNEKLMRQIITLEERLQCELTPPCSHEEVPVRTHSYQVQRKRVKLERPYSTVYPTPSPEPHAEEAVALNTYMTLDSVLDDVISLEQEALIKQEVPPDCYSQCSTSSVFDDVISLEEERMVNVNVYWYT